MRRKPSYEVAQTATIREEILGGQPTGAYESLRPKDARTSRELCCEHLVGAGGDDTARVWRTVFAAKTAQPTLRFAPAPITIS